MERRVFRKLVSLEEALSLALSSVEPKPLGVEVVSLEEAVGRVLAEDILAPIDVPPFDRSSVDGYAVRAEDTYGAQYGSPKELKVVGKVGAGEFFDGLLSKGEAVEVSTGAPLPRGANAVVMVEHAFTKNGFVYVTRPVHPGENLAPAGSDVSRDEPVLLRGTLLDAVSVGVLAALGLKEVKVFRKPVVAVISVGDELVEPGTSLSYGRVYDVNSWTLSYLVEQCGCEALRMGIVGDSLREIEEAVLKALEVADVVLLSGGTSAGSGDLVYRALEELGELVFHGIAAKPGKPTALAVVRQKPVIALPGYPVSALAMFLLVARPLLMGYLGARHSPTLTARVRAAVRMASPMGRREFLPSILAKSGGDLLTFPIPGGSGAIASLLSADCLVVIPEDREFVEAGEELDAILPWGELRVADLIFVGEHCVGAWALLAMASKRAGFDYRAVDAGSSGGLNALRAGVADVAGICLYDKASKSYNTPEVLRRRGVSCVVYRGYQRVLGVMTAPQNPLGVSGFEDIVSRGLRIVNWRKGSFLRTLIDLELEKVAEKRGASLEDVARCVEGYGVEVSSHSEAALAVASGAADVGFGLERVAKRFGLGFIPLWLEDYDFAVAANRVKKPSVKALLEVLKSREFRSFLSQTGGFVVPDDLGSPKF